MLIGLIGKTCSGKTTFFSALTLVPAEISSRTFTTIKPNVGVGFVRKKCACHDLNIKCAFCKGGIRLIPVKIIDVAGLVPEAHKGKGMGNQFLSDMMMADGIIHVVDISGSTDKNGNICAPGTHNPEEDIKWVEEEIVYWMAGLVKKADKKRVEAKTEKLEDALTKQLTGLGVTKHQVLETLKESSIDFNSDNSILEFCRVLFRKSKHMIIAGNKIDISSAKGIYEKLSKNYNIVPCYADGELALRKADEKCIVKYMPGSSSFELINIKGETTTESRLTVEQKAAFEKIKLIVDKNGSTGVQSCLEKLVFDDMNMIVVYPVENEHKFSDGKGRVLPDVFLMKKGSTAIDLAFRIHEDIGKRFIAAVDAKAGRRISADHELKDGDVISIKAGR